MTNEKNANGQKENESLESSDGLEIEHLSTPPEEETSDHTSADCEAPVTTDIDIDDGGPLSI